jgi:hypothetical protein
VREACDRLEIGELQHRIGRRLGPDHLRPRRDRRLDRAKVGEIDEAEIEAGRATAHALEQPEGAAIEVVAGDDVVARIQRLEQRADGGQAGGERKPLRPALQVGQRPLEREARGILAARILEALMHAGRGLGVS